MSHWVGSIKPRLKTGGPHIYYRSKVYVRVGQVRAHLYWIGSKKIGLDTTELEK